MNCVAQIDRSHMILMATIQRSIRKYLLIIKNKLDLVLNLTSHNLMHKTI